MIMYVTYARFEHLSTTRGGGASPYWPISIDPLFIANLTLNDPLFSYSPRPMTFPFFFLLLFLIVNTKFQFFCEFRTEFVNVVNFLKMPNFYSNLTTFKIVVLQNHTPNAHVFVLRQVHTQSLSYSSAPPSLPPPN